MKTLAPKVCRLTVAVKLKPEDLAEIQQALEAKFGQMLALEVRIKRNLIGGFILEKDSLVIDASVANALEDYRKAWVDKLRK